MPKLQAGAVFAVALLAASVQAQYGYGERGDYPTYRMQSAQALAAHITALTDSQFGGGYPQSRRLLAWHLRPVTAHDTVRGLSQTLWRERATWKRRARPTRHYGPSMRRIWSAIGRGDFDEAERRLARLASKTHRHTEIESITTHEVLLELGDIELKSGAHDRAAWNYRTAIDMFAYVPPEHTMLALGRLIAAGFRDGDHAAAMDHVASLARVQAVAPPTRARPSNPPPPSPAAQPWLASLSQQAQ